MAEEQEHPGARGLAAALALFALGFVIAAALLHFTVRDPLHLHADFRSEKLVMLGQLQGSVFSAAFGTSHVHNGFDPRAFDRELAGPQPAGQAGIETHSMNMAVAGGSQAEQRVMALEFVRHIQAPPRGDACLVMLELDAGANFLTGFLVHPRTIDIYDWHTAAFVGQLTSAQMSRTQRLGRIGYALVASGLHYINLGMVSNAIFAPQLNQALVDDQMQADRRGLLEENHGNAKLTEEFDATPRSSRTAPGLLTPGNTDFLREIQSASPGHALDFVYFVFPKFSDLTAEPVYPDHLEVNGHMVPIINMARPSRFPQLYRIALWRDDAHLDRDGAALLSKLLADEIKTWYTAHGGAPPCGG